MATNEGKLKRVQEDLSEILECGICKSFFDDPRMLPCVHSFCLNCLQRAFTQSTEVEGGGEGEGKPGPSGAASHERPRCPLCRREFTLPADGFDGLPKNFFLARLVDTMKIVNSNSNTEKLCDPCQGDPTPGVEPPSAEVYCWDCAERLCASCSPYHRRKRHQLIAIGDAGSDENSPPKAFPIRYYCGQHVKYALDLLCVDCNEVLCPMCFIERHQGHQRRGVDEASKEFREKIQSSINNLTNVQKTFQNCCQRLEQEKNAVLQKTTDLERLVVSAQEEVKKLADQCALRLLETISKAKLETMKRLSAQLDDNNFKLTSLDNYLLYCRRISDEGSDVDVCRAGTCLEARFAEIQRMDINEDVWPSSILQKVFKKTELSLVLSAHQLSLIGALEDEETVAKETVAKETVAKTQSFNELSIINSESKDDDKEGNSSSLELNAESPKWSLLSGLPDNPVPSCDPQFIRVLRTSLGETKRKEIQGIALLNDNLYIVHDRCPEIEVYDINTSSRVTSLVVNHLVDPGDIVAAKDGSSLLIIDWKDLDHDNEILVIHSNGKLKRRWGAPNDYSWLSVSCKNTVIMTLLESSKIHEYNLDGKLISMVKISQLTGISKIWHAIKLSGGDFIVSHGVKGSQGVCRVDSNGNVINLFSGSNYNFRLLHSSVYLAEDWKGSIFVVDQCWKMILQLNSSLEFQKVLLSRSQKLCSPRRICFHDSRNQLFVADEKGKVLIFGV